MILFNFCKGCMCVCECTCVCECMCVCVRACVCIPSHIPSAQWASVGLIFTRKDVVLPLTDGPCACFCPGFGSREQG